MKPARAGCSLRKLQTRRVLGGNTRKSLSDVPQYSLYDRPGTCNFRCRLTLENFPLVTDAINEK